MANVLGNIIKKGKAGVKLFINGVKNSSYKRCDLNDTEVIEHGLAYNYDRYGYLRCSVLHNGEIYIFGNSSRVVNSFKWDGTAWELIDFNFSTNVGYVEDAIEYRNEIYIMAGYDNSSGSSLGLYKLTENTFTLLGGALNINYYYNMIVFNDELYCGYSNELRKWNGTDWENVATLPYSEGSNSKSIFLALNNEIHQLGGYNHYKKHYKFDGTSWEELADLPISINEGNIAFIKKDDIYIVSSNGYYKGNSTWEKTLFGGENLVSNFKGVVNVDDDIYILYRTSNSWSSWYMDEIKDYYSVNLS